MQQCVLLTVNMEDTTTLAFWRAREASEITAACAHAQRQSGGSCPLGLKS